jgi:cell division protein FtsI (penicillin-binding protein 3)
MTRFDSLAPTAAPRWRVWAVATGLGLALVLLLLKAGHLQLSLGDDLRQLAERQYVRKLKVSAPRGNVYDKEGRPLAVTVPAYSVAAEPRRVAEPMAAAAALHEVLGGDRAVLERRLSSGRGFVWLDRRVAPEVADAVKALGIRGVTLRQESRRYYPSRSLAGQTLGLVSIDGDGVDGVERAFDEHLRGRSLSIPGLRDNRGNRIVLADGVDLELLAGDDVYLTLDAHLQHVAEQALVDAVEKYQAKRAFAVVLDPKTGAVRALANAPLFNPNDPGQSPRGARRNHAMSDSFEPGSVFKMVTFAAALDADVLEPDDRIFCENGRIQIGRHTIRDLHPAGWLTASEVFSHSSNIGTIKVVQRVGEERFRQTISDFGFGVAPGLGFLGETRGRLPERARWGDVRTATISFGHGLRVSPVQMAVAVATVANGGVRMQPRLLEKVTSSTGDTVREGFSGEGVRVLKEDTARALSEIMSGVVEAGGTGQRASIRGIRVAGKTGTAEKVDPVTKRYSRAKHLSSFVGFAPVDDPRVVAVVMVDEPQGTVYGGSTAGPAWRTIVEAALIDEGLLTAREAPAEASTSTEPQEPPRADTRVVDVANPELAIEEGTMPSFLGMTARQALVAAEAAGLSTRVAGTGVVVEQQPAPGADHEGAVTLQLGEGA